MQIRFEWDDSKEQINVRKHHIDFKTASRVFLDPNRIEYFDRKHSSLFESRYITIGMVHKILTVIYTERNDAIRIISARIATKQEQEAYFRVY